MNIVFGTKQNQSQLFLEDGTRIPVTSVRVAALPVVQIKTREKEGYQSVQVGLGLGKKKHMSKALLGHIEKAKLSSLPRRVIEIRVAEDEAMPEVGSVLSLADILKPGDIVKVTGTSKGKGFAGGVKRYHFKGGPRTHGQSDRERAPGSLGQTTTPGRVYKGKRMAGHMGVDTATVTNLVVVAVDGETVMIKGLVPGTLKSLIRIEKTGESKKFVAPLSTKEEVAVSEPVATGAPVSETPQETVEVEAKPEVLEKQAETAEEKAKEEKEDHGQEGK